MWIWLVIIIWEEEYFDTCSDPVDLFGFVYLILGAIALGILLLSILGMICGLLRPKSSVTTGLDRGIYENTGDVDFNPYQ